MLTNMPDGIVVLKKPTKSPKQDDINQELPKTPDIKFCNQAMTKLFREDLSKVQASKSILKFSGTKLLTKPMFKCKDHNDNLMFSNLKYSSSGDPNTNYCL